MNLILVSLFSFYTEQIHDQHQACETWNQDNRETHKKWYTLQPYPARYAWIQNNGYGSCCPLCLSLSSHLWVTDYTYFMPTSSIAYNNSMSWKYVERNASLFDKTVKLNIQAHVIFQHTQDWNVSISEHFKMFNITTWDDSCWKQWWSLVAFFR